MQNLQKKYKELFKWNLNKCKECKEANFQIASKGNSYIIWNILELKLNLVVNLSKILLKI